MDINIIDCTFRRLIEISFTKIWGFCSLKNSSPYCMCMLWNLLYQTISKWIYNITCWRVASWVSRSTIILAPACINKNDNFTYFIEFIPILKKFVITFPPWLNITKRHRYIFHIKEWQKSYFKRIVFWLFWQN